MESKSKRGKIRDIKSKRGNIRNITGKGKEESSDILMINYWHYFVLVIYTYSIVSWFSLNTKK